MSEQEDKMSAVFGTAGSPADTEDWKAKYEAEVKAHQKDKVEFGRIRKVQDERDAALKELAELKAKHRSEELFSDLSEEERNSIPDEVLNVNAKVARKIEENVEERLRRIEEREQANREAAQANARKGIVQRVSEAFPKFLSSVSEGGDKHDAWKEYKRYNDASVTGAFESGDFDTLKYHIENFYRSNGIQVPSAQGESAAPEPRSSGGGVQVPTGSGKVYSQEEFNRLFDLKEEARDRGDWAEVRRIGEEITRAPAEGRVQN